MKGIFAEAIREQITQGQRLETILVGKVDREVVLAEFLQHLAADTAGGAKIGNNSILAAADGNGGKSLRPSDTALKTAVRSAQLVGE